MFCSLGKFNPIRDPSSQCATIFQICYSKLLILLVLIFNTKLIELYLAMDDDTIAKLLGTIGIQKFDPLVITALSEYGRSM